MRILFEHADFVIIAKPAHVTMHASSTTVSQSTTISRQAIIPLLAQAFNQPAVHQWHIVHRLDDDTSGCLIIAKHPAAAEQFRVLFSQQQIQKYYVALTDKKGKRKQGWVKGDMVNKRRGQWALTQTSVNPAVSYFQRVGLGNGYYLFWVKPFTGKTHQIRVALKSNSSPIVGDTHYAGVAADRVYLHAYALEFEYSGTPIYITCPVDDNIDNADNNTQLFNQVTVHSHITPAHLQELTWPSQ